MSFVHAVDALGLSISWVGAEARISSQSEYQQLGREYQKHLVRLRQLQAESASTAGTCVGGAAVA